jgi:lipoyl-dependent peroxiredoxin
VQQFEKVLYTAKTRTTGGRENGLSRSYDGHLDVKLAVPGSARIGTNPEQLFAAAWSACLESAIALAANKRKIALPADPVIDAEVDIVLAEGGSSFVAERLVHEAHKNCPYSKATRGNIDVAVTLA